MMIDLETIDALFEHSLKVSGEPLGTFIFDKRMLVPREHFLEMLGRETELDLTVEQLDAAIDADWVPVPFLPMEDEAGKSGFPLYATSRVEFLHELLESGYGRAELALVVEHEEFYIDYCLTDLGFEYEDDDVRLIVRDLDEELDSLRGNPSYLRGELDRPVSTRNAELHGGATPDEVGANIAKVVASRDAYMEMDCDQLRPERRLEVSRVAFRIRMRDEAIRCWLLEQERDKIRAGYGPTLSFTRTSQSVPGGFEGHGIRWKESLSHPLVTEDDDSLPVRVPGFLLASRDGYRP